ncbi:MAG TPA: transglutaminase domain-containing protein, partial [Candidatus Angelobacter sp.]|nr:transglutaminase domain-containing protein [Candidatus Angelobacter sp.]
MPNWRREANFPKAMKNAHLRLLVLVLGMGLCSYGATPSQDWLPVTPQDLRIKEVPGTPNAPAIQLYYAHYISVESDEQSHFFYYRIKLLTDAGRQYADVEIPVFPGVKLTDLQARTIRPDGSIVAFTGAPFEKTLIKGRGIKILAQTFTLPEAGAGSIIEYKYKLKAWAFMSNHWEIQHNLFTVREHFLYLSPPTFVPVTYVVSKSIPKLPSKDKNNFDLELENVPAFEPDEQMPPEETYKQVVYFFTGYMGLPDFFWATQMRAMATDFEEFIGNHKEIRAAAEEATRGIPDPQEKLRKLYARAQQIRNLGYERERTESEDKKEDLKPSKNVVDILKHDYGFHNGISAYFVALARAAGFDAQIVVASSRRDRFFQKGLLDAG